MEFSPAFDKDAAPTRRPKGVHLRLQASDGLALLGLLLFILIGLRWIWVYRHGQPLDIDEAGYLGIALIDYYALAHEGISSWLSAVQTSGGYQAPLTTALSSLLFYFTGPHVIVGFAVPLLAATGCILATYFLGKSVGSRQIGLLASMLVASCPDILRWSREFHFSMLATLVVTFALLALLRSNRFEQIGWSMLFGLSLGLMPLARTMTIAFIPGMVVGAFVYTIVDQEHRARRLLLFTTSMLLAALTSATWLVRNAGSVSEYLFNFGYGAAAREYYGPETFKFGLDAVLNVLRVFCNYDVQLPHLLAIVAGLMATLVVALIAGLKTGPAGFLNRTLRSRMLPILIFTLAGLLALATSRNKGTAFFAPLVPALMVLTVWVFFKISENQFYRFSLVALFAALAVIAGAPFVDLRTPLARPWLAEVPGLGVVMVTDGRGYLQIYEANGGLGPSSVSEPLSAATGRSWVRLNAETANNITALYGPRSVIAFGFLHYLYNVNTVNLHQLLNTGVNFAPRQLDPMRTGDTIQGYESWLAREGGDACVVLTSDLARGDSAPAVNGAYMREAVEKAGLISAQQWPTPDGQTVTLWVHRTAPSTCRN
jgi:4-amino-4-deoxy-L-arabinose transferase-like glycosyltransferase